MVGRAARLLPVAMATVVHPSLMCARAAIPPVVRAPHVRHLRARDDERIVNSEGASVSTGSSLRVLGTSAGFLQGYAGTMQASSRRIPRRSCAPATRKRFAKQTLCDGASKGVCGLGRF